jgi:hypothetical protein
MSLADGIALENEGSVTTSRYVQLLVEVDRKNEIINELFSKTKALVDAIDRLRLRGKLPKTVAFQQELDEARQACRG